MEKIIRAIVSELSKIRKELEKMNKSLAGRK